MNRFLRIYFIAFLLLFGVLPCSAEELDPRRWAHIPIDTNFAGTAYAYTEADIGLDPVLRLENVRMDLHTWGAKYIRSFSLFKKTAQVSILQAYQEGQWSGLLNGASASTKRNGLTDTVVRFATNLYGAPPLKGKDYAEYRAATKNETNIGVGLSLQLPTGNYMSDKLINLGTNRYTLRPELGIMHARGKWSTEVSGIAAIYSDNDNFYNGLKLKQDPLYIIHGHILYAFRPGVWASISVGFDYGGKTTVNREKKNDLKQNVGWALSFGVPVSRHVAIKTAYVGTRTQESTGIDSDTLSIAIAVFW
jgi:hypothetical protein